MARIDESGLTAAKIRDMPVNGKLRRVLLAAAADAGVDVVCITSGGQPGSRGQRTGSNRHDGGNAADLELIANGRTLNFTAAGDLATICRFVAAAAAQGAIGIGAGVDYMGPTRLHVGFGNGPQDTSKVVWGAGGAPANAPAWLSEAASYGWANPSTPGEAWPEQPIGGDVIASDPDGRLGPGGEAVGRLQRLLGAFLHYSGRSDGIFGWIWRGPVALFQFCSRSPVTGGHRRCRRGHGGRPDQVCRFLPHRRVAPRRAWRYRPRQKRRRLDAGHLSPGPGQVSRDAGDVGRPSPQSSVRRVAAGFGGGEAGRRGRRPHAALGRLSVVARPIRPWPDRIGLDAGTWNNPPPVRRENHPPPSLDRVGSWIGSTNALESRERFLLANALQVLANSLGQIAPVIMAVLVSPSLTVVIPTVAVMQAVSTIVIGVCVYRLEGPFSFRAFDRSEARTLLHYGGWVTVTAVIYPFLVAADQFLIGSLLGVAEVAHYAVPMNLILRSGTIPMALGRTFFPRLSSLPRDAAHVLAGRALEVLGYGYAAVCAPGIILASVFFRYWIGPDFALVSAPVAQILFIGVWFTGLSFVAFTLIQSQGRPDLTGRLHFAELLPFLGVLWVLTVSFGINGAAAAWTLRCIVDAFAMFWAAGISRRDVVSVIARPAALLCGSAIAARFVGSSLSLAIPAAVLAGLISIGLAYAYSDDLRRILTSQLVRAWGIGGGLIRRVKPAQSA